MSAKSTFFVSFVLVLGVVIAEPPCRANLVSWWRLDSLDAGGKFPDAVGDNPGTPSGATSLDTAIRQIGGGSAHFTGNGDINVGQGALMFIGESAMTITAWVNPADAAGTKGIFSRTTGNNACYNLRLDGSKLRVGLNTNGGWNLSANDSADIPVDTWTHIAMVYDGSSAMRYINGEVSGTVMATTGTALAQQGTA